MNQILVTKKLYITPELKRKKKIYKFNFFLSVFLVCALILFCIYAEYDRNKSEEVSQELLSEFSQDMNNMQEKSNILIAVLNENNEDENLQEVEEAKPQTNLSNQNLAVKTTDAGYNYMTIASISIPKIDVNYSIIVGETGSLEETEALLKISPTKFWGPNPNEVGNFCIVGHNYRNTKFFSKVPTLENGDIIEITDSNNRKINYEVYNKYEVVPEDTTCLDQTTYGRKEITLITCTNDSKLRVIVKAREV